VLSDEQVIDRGREACDRGCTELHIVGGLHHQLPYEWYLNVIRVLHREFPDLHLKAWTAVEWDWFARLTGRPTKDLLAEMRDAGLGSLPGGGAEIFHPDVRRKICEHKADADEWIRVHREAHELGLRSNATMLYGHIEGPEHRIDHLIRLRDLQELTVDDLRRLITEAGRVPVERDTLYHEVVREGGTRWKTGKKLVALV